MGLFGRRNESGLHDIGGKGREFLGLVRCDTQSVFHISIKFAQSFEVNNDIVRTLS